MNKRNLTLVCAVVVALAFVGVSAHATQATLADGGFENPDDQGNVTPYNAGGRMGAWTVGVGAVDHVRTSSGFGNAAEGNLWLDLNEQVPGSIYQDIATTPGRSYTLTFAFAGNPYDQPSALKTIDLEWGGKKVRSFEFDITGHDPQNMGWRQETVELTATKTTTRLEFVSTSEGIAGPALDDVSLDDGPAASQGDIGVSSFNPGLNSLVAIVFDHQANNLFIYPEHGAEILEYTTSGSPVGSGIPPPGTSNDIDLDFAVESLTVGGDSVSANTLLVSNGDAGNILYAIDKDTGSVETQQQLNAGLVTGGAQHPLRDTFFILSWEQQTISEIDPDDGSVLNSFPVAPEGSAPFRTNYSDIDVNNETGNIIVVSDFQNSIRQLSPTGEWLGDLDVFNDDNPDHPLRVEVMTGLAIDDATKDVWISARTGIVWKLTNVWDKFSTAAPCESDPNSLCGTEEDDDIQGTPENDTIYAGGGDDVIDGGGGQDTIIGGAGDDVLVGGGQNDRLNGGPGNDVISGDQTTSAAAASLYRRTGLLSFLQQEDSPPGADTLQGGGGNDTVLGGGGADKVLGQAGNDELEGEAGPDLLKGGGGVNDFDGGAGKDKCVLENPKDTTKSCEKKTRNFTRNFWPTRVPGMPVSSKGAR